MSPQEKDPGFAPHWPQDCVDVIVFEVGKMKESWKTVYYVHV
jgi:hypothetical protein